MADLYNGAPRSFTATQQIQYQNAYKRKYRDRSIMGDITNSDYKGKFYKKGTTIRVPIQPTVIIRDTQPGGGIIYQKPTDTFEDFTIGRESYWGLEFMPEDTAFAPWDPKSPIVADAADEMAEHIERKFGLDIINKCDALNTGNTAGARSGGFKLGEPGSGNQVFLYGTEAACKDSSKTYKCTAADHIVHCGNCLKEQKGGKGQDLWCVMPTIVGDRIQTSELKLAGLYDDRNSLLRSDVSMLGKLNGMTLIQDDVMLPIFKDVTNGCNVYPILFGSKKAISYADEVVFRDNGMKDVGSWDEFHRCKTVYDWFVTFPEFFGVSYVSIG